MMKWFYVCLTLLLLAVPQVGNAATILTGEDLQETCNATETVSECLSYLELVYWTSKSIARMSDGEWQGAVGSCGPDKGLDTVPLFIAMRNAWQLYASQHPEHLRRRATETALLAFEQQWPCAR